MNVCLLQTRRACLLQIKMLLKVLSFAIFILLNLRIYQNLLTDKVTQGDILLLFISQLFYFILCGLLDSLNYTELTASDSENNDRKIFEDKN